jgi:hypothetical protein
MKRSIRSGVIWLIKFYQVHVSPIFGPKCRFIPTCSAYTLEAIQRHGLIKGCFLGLKRLMKCHPFYKGKLYDPVPPKK